MAISTGRWRCQVKVKIIRITESSNDSTKYRGEKRKIENEININILVREKIRNRRNCPGRQGRWDDLGSMITTLYLRRIGAIRGGKIG